MSSLLSSKLGEYSAQSRRAKAWTLKADNFLCTSFSTMLVIIIVDSLPRNALFEMQCVFSHRRDPLAIASADSPHSREKHVLAGCLLMSHFDFPFTLCSAQETIQRVLEFKDRMERDGHLIAVKAFLRASNSEKNRLEVLYEGLRELFATQATFIQTSLIAGATKSASLQILAFSIKDNRPAYM